NLKVIQRISIDRIRYHLTRYHIVQFFFMMIIGWDLD
ncbi:hypothetical protein LINGRAHAP2_LOCUS27801, partial [Linum grandiflorum]